MLKISTAPHLNSPLSTRGIMGHVIIAMLPLAFMSIAYFGISALEVIITSVAGCVLFEYLISRYLMKVPNSTRDLSAVVTGLLLAFNLPAGMPIWMTLVGCLIAIGVAKMAFGGIGKNLFNPAILKHMDALSTASQHHLPQYWEMFVGYTGGSLGEVSTAAILLGFIYMLWKKIIGWEIPVYYIGTFLIFIGIHWLLTGETRYEPMTHILSGGLMLGAVFMATDYTTSPMTRRGRIIFAIGCGFLTYIIRIYSVYPEGVSFAILIMNAFVPIIDMTCIPRVFGSKERK